MIIPSYFSWYKVNYSYAEQLLWGRASGCEFAAGSCGGYIKAQREQFSRNYY